MAELFKSFMELPGYIEYSPTFPNPLICIRDMLITGVRETIDRLPWNGVGQWLEETWDWMSLTLCLSWDVLVLPLLLAVLFTLLRVTLNHAILYRIPKWFKFNAESSQKFPESVFKCLVYTVTWSWAVYLVVYGEYNFFYNLRSQWQSWYPRIDAEPGLYWLYMVELGFYLHSAYATVYIETIRKDFVVLMLHHILTLALLLFSYIIRFHNIGLLVLFVLDIGDVVLELSKTIVYFKVRNDKEHYWPELFANIGFACFTLQHILFRIYWFPTKVIYSATHVGVNVFPGGPYLLVFVPMVWALYAMQVYWFKFILVLLWKIVVKGEKVADTREYDEEDREGKPTLDDGATPTPVGREGKPPLDDGATPTPVGREGKPPLNDGATPTPGVRVRKRGGKKRN